MTPDDEDWFEALAGRARPGTDPATMLEATLLRGAARRWRAEAPAASAMPLAEERLVEQARNAGLLSRRPGFCAGCAQRWRRLMQAPWRLGFGLAFAALAGLVAVDLLRPPESEPVVRGAERDGVWLLRDAAPQPLRERIAADLEGAGARVQRYERLGRFGLEAEWTPPPSPALQAAIARHGLPAGGDGALQVEVEAARP